MKRHPQSTGGYSTIVVMIVLITIVSLVGTAFTLTSNFARQANRQRQVLQAQDAAESALEYVYAKWKSDIKAAAYAAKATTQVTVPSTMHPALASAPSTGTGVAPLFMPWATTVPTTVSYTTVDQWGATQASPTKIKVANVPGYPGWVGDSVFYKAEATGKISGINDQGIRRYFQLTFVPLMQAAVFYEDDLEIHPGPPMTINGLVHTNKDLEVLAYDKLQFMDNVSFAGNYREEAPGNWSGSGSSDYTNPTEKPYWKDNKQTDDSASVVDQLEKVDRIEPLGARPKQVLDPKYDEAPYVDSDGNFNNDGYREIIEKPVAGADATEISSTRFYNKASLKIEVDSSKASNAAGYLKVYNASNVAYATGDNVYKKVQTAITGSSSMYDQREGATLKVTSIDMKKFNDVIATMGSNFNGVVYITDTSTDSTKDGIRLTNGRVIDADLTVATDEGMYIQGDYNTGGSNASNVPSNTSTTGTNHASNYDVKSTAVAADAVTILSNNWTDGNASSQLTSRVATNTTVNTGIISGNVPTNYNSSGNPSGGVHNFPRFLEMWLNPNNNYSEVNFTYYGSMVELFHSKSFTGLWYTNNTYWPPNRIWNFDTNFRTDPPPGTLQPPQFSRGRWERM